MADRYWIAGTGDWSDTAHWSTSSGGASGASVPTSADNAIFNASSGGGTATINTTERECLSLTTTGYTGTIARSQKLNIYGSLTIGSSTSFSGSQDFAMAATSGSHTITTNGINIQGIEIGKTASTATWTLQDNLNIGTSIIEILYGTFDANDFNVSCGALRDSVASSQVYATLMMGNGTWTLTGTGGDLIDFFDITVDVLKEGSNIVVSSTTSTAKNYDLGSKSWPKITLPTSTAVHTFKDGGNIDDLVMPAGTTVNFEAAKTFGFGRMTSNGVAGNRVTIASTIAATQFTLQPISGTDISIDYATIQDSNAIGSIRWFAGNHSVDVSNNDGWIFSDHATYLWSRSARSIEHSLQVSWKKDFSPTIRLFTIGVSSIGGNDLIAASEQLDSRWNKYFYFDESTYVLAMDWEQGLNMPIGGVSQGLASGMLENTTNRFTPYYMGGNSELFTAILPRRPFIVNAGFNDNGNEVMYPQFVGLFTKQPEVQMRERTLGWSGADFINFLANRYVDNTAMFTGQRSDQLIERILQNQGFTTAQYDLDYGINNIPFAIFTKGERFSEIINKIAQAENAHFYQDNEGVLRFENRQHWDNVSSPDYDIFTSQVLDAKAPDEDHIINVVEIKASIREKQPLQTVFSLPPLTSILIPAGGDVEQFFSFEDPVLALTDPTSGGANSFYKANSAEDDSGTDLTSSVSVTNLGTFAEAVKYRFRNNTTRDAYITQFVLAARVAKNTKDLYYRAQDDSSVTAYEERPYVVENPYIHEESWAASFAQLILNDYAEPENLQEITIMAIPTLRVGNLVSWQGRYWRVFNKRTRLDPSIGFVQELTLLKRTTTSYFRIGISTIGSGDLIAP